MDPPSAPGTPTKGPQLAPSTPSRDPQLGPSTPTRDLQLTPSTPTRDPQLALASALQRIESLESEKKGSVEQFKKAATALAKLGELEKECSRLNSKLDDVTSQRDEIAEKAEMLEETDKSNVELIKQLSQSVREKTEMLETMRKNVQLQSTTPNKDETEKLNKELVVVKEMLQTAVQAKEEVERTKQDELLLVRAKLSNNVEEVEKERDDARSKVASLTAQLETSTVDVNSSKTDELQQELKRVRSELEQANAEAAKVKLEVQRTVTQITKQSEETTSANGKVEYEKGVQEGERRYKDEVVRLQERVQEAIDSADAKDQVIVEHQIELASKDSDLKEALNNIQQLDGAIAEHVRTIAELEKKHEAVISESLLNQELIQQQLHTIAQLKGDEEEEGKATPRGATNIQDHLVTELTELVGTLRESNEKLTEQARGLEEEVTSLRALLQEKDVRITTLMQNDNGEQLTSLVSDLRGANEQLRTSLEELLSETKAKAAQLEHAEMDVNSKDERIASLTDQETAMKQLIKEKELRITALVEESETQAKNAIAAELAGQAGLSDTIHLLEGQLEKAKEEATKYQLQIEENKARIRDLEQKGDKIKELEENEEKARKSINTAEAYTKELTRQLEDLNASVRQLEDQLDAAKEESREKEERMAEEVGQLRKELVGRDERIRAIGDKSAEERVEIAVRLSDREKELESLKSQNTSLVSKLHTAEQNTRSIQSSQAERITELEQQLTSKEEGGKSFNAMLLEAKQQIDMLNAAVEAKEAELTDVKSRHVESIKQLVAQNSELLLQSDKGHYHQTDLEHNLSELANSYRQLSERSDADAQQYQESLSASKVAHKTLLQELESLKKDYEDRILKMKSEYESSPKFPPQVEMQDVALNEKYDEALKETHLLRTHMQQLETELENTKEALRKKNESDRTSSTAPPYRDMESGDAWARLGGSNALCYAPVAAMSYWRRWMGRPDDVHNS